MTKVPNCFRTEILARRMTQKELEDLSETYHSAKFSLGQMRYQPSKAEWKLFDQYIAKKLSFQEFADQTGCNIHTARNRIGAMATMRLME